MRFVQRARVTLLRHELARRPSAAGTYTVSTAQGVELQASTAATLDPVDTTLGAAAAVGALELTLTSTSDVATGRRYLLGGPEAEGGEVVTVRGVSGSTVVLAARTTRAWASGASFEGTRVTVSIPSITGPQRNCRVEYFPPDGDAEPSTVIPFDVVRYMVTTGLTTADLRVIDPLIAKRIPQGTWMPDVMSRAWDMLCGDVATQCDPGAVVGAVDLAAAHGYLTRFLLAEMAGDDDAAKDARDRYIARYRAELERALATLSRDTNQDGAATNRPFLTSQTVGRS